MFSAETPSTCKYETILHLCGLSVESRRLSLRMYLTDREDPYQFSIAGIKEALRVSKKTRQTLKQSSLLAIDNSALFNFTLTNGWILFSFHVCSGVKNKQHY